MVTVTDQFAAVLAAPVPFALALLVFWFAIWKMMEWRYGAVIEKTSAMMRLAELEATAAIKKRDELDQAMKKMRDELEVLKKQAESKSPLTFDLLVPLSTSSINASNLLTELGRANTAVSDALNRGIMATPQPLTLTMPNIPKSE
jgi:hypothetical protein